MKYFSFPILSGFFFNGFKIMLSILTMMLMLFLYNIIHSENCERNMEKILFQYIFKYQILNFNILVHLLQNFVESKWCLYMWKIKNWFINLCILWIKRCEILSIPFGVAAKFTRVIIYHNFSTNLLVVTLR